MTTTRKLDDQVEAGTPARPVLLVVGVLVAFFAILADASGSVVLQQTLAEAFETTPERASLSYGCYFVAYVSPLLMAGRLGDQLGARRVFTIGGAGFVLASLGSAVAPSLGVLLITRTLQGLFGGAVAPQLLAILKLCVPARMRGAVMTANGLVVVLAFFLGPSTAGLVAIGSWRGFYLIGAGLTAGAVISVDLAGRGLTPGSQARVPIGDAALSFLGPAAAAGGLLLLGTEVPPVVSIVTMLIGVLLVAVFARRQRSAPLRQAITPPALFGVRGFTVSCLATLQLGLATTAMLAAVMGYLQSERGLSALGAGLMLTPMAGMALFVSPLVARRTSRDQEWHLVVAGFALLGGTLLTLACTASATTPMAFLGLLSALCGVACACVFGPLSAVSVRYVDPALTGAASGLYNFARQFGAAVGASAVVVVTNSPLPDWSAGYLSSGPDGAAVVLTALIMLCASATSTVGLRSRSRPTPVEEAPTRR